MLSIHHYILLIYNKVQVLYDFEGVSVSNASACKTNKHFNNMCCWSTFFPCFLAEKMIQKRINVLIKNEAVYMYVEGECLFSHTSAPQA